MANLNMKRIYSLLIFTSAALHLWSQTTDTLDRKTTVYGYSTAVLFESGSSGMNQYMLYRMGLGGYMSPEKIENAEKHIHKQNRLGVRSIYEIGILLKAPGDTSRKARFAPSRLYISQQQFLGAKHSMGAWQLVFRGNAPYLGKTLDFGNTAFTQFGSRSLVAQWDKLLTANSGKFSISGSLGVGQLLAYRKMNISQGTIYTDTSRNYVDAKYSADYTNAGANAGKGMGYGGLLGLDFNLSLSNNRMFHGGVRDLGWFKYNNADVLTKNMSEAVRINQTSVGLKTLNSADWLEYLKDTVNVALAPDSSTNSKWIMAPTRFFLTYQTAKARVSLDYLRITGYLPRLTYMPAKFIRLKSFSLLPEAQLGGFDTWNVNMQMVYTHALGKKSDRRYIYAYLQLRGIEAMMFPGLTHGAGLQFGISVMHF